MLHRDRLLGRKLFVIGRLLQLETPAWQSVNASAAHVQRNGQRLNRHTPKDDLISALIAVEEGGDRLSENELIAMLAWKNPLRLTDSAQWVP